MKTRSILVGRRILVISVVLVCLAGTAYPQKPGIVRQPLQQIGALKLPLRDPRIVVIKSKRLLELYSGGAVVRRFRVGLGLNPVEDKKRQGDRATPEVSSISLRKIARAHTTCRSVSVIRMLKTPSVDCVTG